VNDFHRARRQAGLQEVIAKLTGKSTDLLSFQEVRKRLRAVGEGKRTLEDIPLDAIVGSVGRYDDFNRKFLPLHLGDQERWAQVRMAIEEKGLPPIEVYQIGKAYFVLDGNHRVSVARQVGASHIQAYVTEVPTKVPISPDDQLDDILIKAEQVNFLEATRLEKLRPQFDFRVTVPGRYNELLEHISVHRWYLGIEQGREISWEEAVTSWADKVYAPVVEVIHNQGILRDFPGRTATDLYLWLMKHRSELADALGWEVQPQEAATDLAARFGERAKGVLARLGKLLLNKVVPNELEPGPAPGSWRREKLAPRQENRLFSTILVPISDREQSSVALEQAILVAQREAALLRGLHVVRREKDKQGKNAQAIKAEFERRLEAAGLQGDMVFEAGDVTDNISRRAAWSDLLVVHLRYPPPDQRLAKLRYGIRTLIHSSPTPILAVPRPSEMQRALLAYDGSPKAEEALFLSTYLALHWGTDLVVLGETESERARPKTEERARTYLKEHGVKATFVSKKGPAGEALLEVAKEHQRDLIVMGGYRWMPMLEAVLGSAVDEVLRGFNQPVLICR